VALWRDKKTKYRDRAFSTYPPDLQVSANPVPLNLETTHMRLINVAKFHWQMQAIKNQP